LFQIEKHGLIDGNKTNIVVGKRGKKFCLVYLDDTKELIKQYLQERGEDNIDSLWIKGSGSNKQPITGDALYDRVCSISKILSEVRGEECNIFPHTMRHSRLECLAQGTDTRLVDENGNIEVPGCIRNGIDSKSANTIFDEMAEFAKYAFNKSHAAAYSVVSYRTAYLKAYYPEEFMAATLNSYLGNLDKVPIYIDECKRLNIEILKPDINKSYTKFTVQDGKIRFGLGSIKNVGVAAIETVIKERTENGEFKSFTDFCERIQSGTVNKKCIECLIKAGCFDEMNQTRATLLASFENIIDVINNQGKNQVANQVSMFDMIEQPETLKYKYTILNELDEKEMLSLEKEMLGIYLSGHPLEKIKEAIKKQTNINSLQIRQLNEENMSGFRDGQIVKYAGTITSIKKKYTKRNTIMAFITVEDLYGNAEIVVFDSIYSRCDNILVEENIIIVEGRLSIKEDEEARIIVQNIKEFSEEAGEEKRRKNLMKIDITELVEDQREKLKGAIRFFSGDRVNMKLSIVDKDEEKPCGAIYLTDEILEQFKEIVGEKNVELE